MKSALKYKNVPTEVDGIRFASKKEARRYGELKLLEKAGEIRDLKLQPRYPLSTDMKRLGYYVADFCYCMKSGAVVVEDVKSPATRKNPLYRWKKRHFEAEYCIPITEV